MSAVAETAFREHVRGRLAGLESALVPVLAQLVVHEYPSEVVAVDFEIFSDGFTSRFPVRAFFMDEMNCEHFVYVDGEASYPSPVDPGLLEIDGVYSESVEEKLFGDNPDVDPWSLATTELSQWFLACWINAGGKHFKLAATIAHHDSSKELNLKTGEWQDRGSAFVA